jgi:hypothetical protein
MGMGTVSIGWCAWIGKKDVVAAVAQEAVLPLLHRQGPCRGVVLSGPVDPACGCRNPGQRCNKPEQCHAQRADGD